MMLTEWLGIGDCGMPPGDFDPGISQVGFHAIVVGYNVSWCNYCVVRVSVFINSSRSWFEHYASDMRGSQLFAIIKGQLFYTQSLTIKTQQC